MNYTYDNIGEVASAMGKEPGGVTNRLHEQFAYAYDPAGNLSVRTNNALVQTYNVNSLNELTHVGRTGTLTVEGTTTSPATNVTVNGSNSVLYVDNTFASTNQPISSGLAYTAIAQDNRGTPMTQMPLPKFWQASTIEVERYYEWYVSTVKERLEKLTALYRSTGGSGNLDLSFESLGRLARWIKENVQLRSCDNAEIEVARKVTPSWLIDSLRVPILTDLWYNLSGDVGTYIGECFIKQYPSLSWNLSAKPRGSATFGRPVLRLRSKLEFSPISVAHGLMVGIEKFPDPAKRLDSICLYWKELIEKEHNRVAPK